MLLLVFVVVGCRVQRESIRATHDTITIKEYQLLHDSVFVDHYHNIYTKGDTVFKTDSIYRLMYKYEQIHDTLNISSTDTVTSVITKVAPSERSQYDKFVSWGFWILLLLILTYITIRVIWKMMSSRL